MSNIGDAVLKEFDSGRYPCQAWPVGVSSLADGFKASGFMQGNLDVHGSHPLFYWTRSRGQGIVIASEAAATVLHYSSDMERIVVLRPTGPIGAIVSLMGDIVAAVRESHPSVDMVVRYCGPELAIALRQVGWRNLSRPLLPSAFADDETWPEVLITWPPAEFPRGAAARDVRNALNRYHGKYEYRSERHLLACGERDFVLSNSSRSRINDRFEDSFNSAVISFLDQGNYQSLKFHYLFDKSKLIGFSITGKNTHIAHSYYMGTVNESQLATYFFWQIHLTETKEGASSFNLGGSETESLHRYKTRTFGDYSTMPTKALETPGLLHSGCVVLAPSGR